MVQSYKKEILFSFFGLVVLAFGTLAIVVLAVVRLDRGGSWEVVIGSGGRSGSLGRLPADWPDGPTLNRLGRPFLGGPERKDDRSGRSSSDSRGDGSGLGSSGRLEDLERQIPKSTEVEAQY